MGNLLYNDAWKHIRRSVAQILFRKDFSCRMRFVLFVNLMQIKFNVNECNGYKDAGTFFILYHAIQHSMVFCCHHQNIWRPESSHKTANGSIRFLKYYTGRPGRRRGWGQPFRRATQNTAGRPRGEGVRRPVLSGLLNYGDAADLLAPEIWIKEMARNGKHEAGASNCERSCPQSWGVCSPNSAVRDGVFCSESRPWK